MNLVTSLLFIALAVGQSAIAHAQDSLVGKYSGDFPFTAPNARIFNLEIQIEIKSLEGDVIKGTMALGRGWKCKGESPAEGTFKNNEVELNALTETRDILGCAKPKFKGSLAGGSLTGQWSSELGIKDVKLTR